MMLRIAFIALGGVLSLCPAASAQLAQIGRDYSQPMTYAPADPFSKGWVYRLQTGQAGKYFNCDGEEQKRYSPYIYWQTVCNQTHPVPYCRVLLRDLQEVKARVRSGACRGGENEQAGTCQTAQSGDYLAGQSAASGEGGGEDSTREAMVAESNPAGPPQVELPAETGWVAEETAHVVRGSRATRQRMARQGAFGESSPASDPRIAERDAALQPGVTPRR